MAMVTCCARAQDARAVDAGVDELASRPVEELTSPPDGADAWTRACSMGRRACLGVSPGTPEALGTATLEALERVWDLLVFGIGLPPPVGTDDGRWELYLVERVEDGWSDAFLSGREPLPSFDRGSSFGVIDRSTPVGCPLERAVGYAIARGSLWRSAPATDEGSARAQAEMLARLASPCAADADDIRAFQSQPDRCIIDPRSASFDRGASVFFGWLDETFGARPGGLVVGLSALSPTLTHAATWNAGRWSDTPTAFDVLRVSLRDALWQGSTLDDLFVEFAVARGLSGDPRPPIGWRVPWPARPRRLASPAAVAPTGASYVVVDCAGAPSGARLRVEMEWEDYARMRWVVVKVDPAGRALARLSVGSPDRATHAGMTVSSLDGVDHVLVVGVNVGDPDHAFDPDAQRWEPHGWLLTVAAE